MQSDNLSPTELKRVMQLLQEFELVDVSSANFNIEYIFAGTINKNFKVSDGQHSVLMKVFSQPNILPINRTEVFTLQQELAVLGLAPQPLLLSDDSELYFEQWLSDLRNGQQIIDVPYAFKRLADSLYNVHSTFISAPILPLCDHWDSYMTHISNINDALHSELALMKAAYIEYEAVNKSEYVLCHNDLNIDHLCINSDTIIDWEYAACGCRYFDIANCASINQLDERGTRLLCDEYAKLSNQCSTQVWENVQKVFKFVRFTSKLWYISVGIDKKPA